MANEHTELLQVMKMVELFRGLSEEQLSRLAQITQREVYGSGEVVFQQGTTGEKMYIIGNGQVEVQVRDSEGTSYAAVYLGEGQVFGEMALVDDGRRSASVLGALQNTIVYSIPNHDFVRLCKSDTAIGYVMMRNIAQDLSFKLRHRDHDPSTNQ